MIEAANIIIVRYYVVGGINVLNRRWKFYNACRVSFHMHLYILSD